MIGKGWKARRRRRRADKLLREHPLAHEDKAGDGTEVILVPRLYGRKKQ